MKENLPKKEKELLTEMEDSLINIIKHPEWFQKSVTQKNVYLLVMNIEDKWFQPFVDSKINILTEEKNRLEAELKTKLINESSK